MKLLFGSVFVISVILFIWIKMRKKDILMVIDTPMQGEKEKHSLQIRIKVERNGYQINIHVFQMDDEEIGHLLATYTGNKYNEQEKYSRAVHIEQLFVKRKFRRKGIAKVIFRYLMEEMKRIEQLEDFEFTLLYGEVGNTGTDDPHISLPFYRKIDGTEYNQEKRLRFSLEKKAALDGLDCFKYVIEKRG